MLPLTIQFVIAMVAHAINQRMARRLDYLLEELCVLKETLAVATVLRDLEPSYLCEASCRNQARTGSGRMI
jgi:hypothetical protein